MGLRVVGRLVAQPILFPLRVASLWYGIHAAISAADGDLVPWATIAVIVWVAVRVLPVGADGVDQGSAPIKGEIVVTLGEEM